MGVGVFFVKLVLAASMGLNIHFGHYGLAAFQAAMMLFILQYELLSRP